MKPASCVAMAVTRLVPPQDWQLYGLLQILETRPKRTDRETGVLSHRGDIMSAIHGSAIHSSAIHNSAIHRSMAAMGFSFSVDFVHNGRPSISTPHMGPQRR